MRVRSSSVNAAHGMNTKGPTQMPGETIDQSLTRPAGDGRTTRTHPLDLAIAWLSRRSKQFSRGWGDAEVLARFSARERYLEAPAPVTVKWNTSRSRGRDICHDGTFVSPLGALPEPAKTVHVRAWSRDGNGTACVMLAASRDEGYWIRERVFGPLTERGIDLYLLENPFYGLRRVGRGPSEITVGDHGLMALGMVLEARALLNHLRPRYQKLAVAGYSMGGHMAAITAAVTPLPLACAALATGASASSIYTRGLLSWSVDLETLGSGAEGQAAACERLRELFDIADVTRYRPPVRADAAVVSGCTGDGYVLPSETERLHRHWRGSTLRWIASGHFSALLTNRKALRDCVVEAVAKL